jgi:hypothetical protein
MHAQLPPCMIFISPVPLFALALPGRLVVVANALLGMVIVDWLLRPLLGLRRRGLWLCYALCPSQKTQQAKTSQENNCTRAPKQ